MRAKPGAIGAIVRAFGVPDGWQPKVVGDLAKVVGGATPSRDDNRFWSGGTIAWASPTDLTEQQTKYIQHTTDYITEAGLASCSTALLPVGTVLFTSRATIGAKAIAAIPITTNQGFANFIPNVEVTSEFLYYYLDLLTPVLIRLGAGTTFLEVSKRDIRKVQCAIPHPDEQAIITSILDGVDEVIKRTHTTLKKARRVKRGLMQSLLPQWIGFKKIDSSALPKGFEIELASEVARVVNGTTPSRDEPAYWRQGTLAWLATGKVNERIIRTASEYVTPKALAECSIELLPKGTVLVAMIGQGKTRGMCAYMELEACINQNFGAFVPKPRLIGKYLYHYFDYHYNSLREMGGGTNQGALNCYMLKRLRLPLPLRERQIEIAEQLDTCDAVIQKHLDSLRTLEILKRGLVQDLLTGKVRVNQLAVAESASD